MSKTPGQLAYEEDVRRCQNYPSGKPRAAWDAIGSVEQQTWEQNPTARDYQKMCVCGHADVYHYANAKGIVRCCAVRECHCQYPEGSSARRGR
jgi:hypothetical protein